MTRATRLKRRSPAPSAPVDEPISEIEQGQEPPLKKFKALFDATDPEKMVVDSGSLQDTAMEETQGGESLTQSDSRPRRSQMAATQRVLEVVAEEEEESVPSQARAPAPALPRPGRKSPSLPEAQGPHADATQDPRVPRSKQTKSKPTQNDQMDTDPEFLTAVASRKGRKKTGEDGFDREFDKLRITKPDIRREEEEKSWELLGDFDMDTRSMRGNFMVVMELEVFRRDPDHRNVTRSYDGLKNYKKFKKVCIRWSFGRGRLLNVFSFCSRHPTLWRVLRLS